MVVLHCRNLADKALMTKSGPFIIFVYSALPESKEGQGRNVAMWVIAPRSLPVTCWVGLTAYLPMT